MNKVTYKNQDLTSYLLGTLPEAETEVFDELSFTDDDFADELKIAEKDLIDAYVNQELQGENLERFNKFYLASPLRREKVEFAKAFQIFAEKEYANNSVEENQKEKTGFFSNFFIFAFPSWQWGVALGILILLFLGSWFGLKILRQNSEFNQAQNNPEIAPKVSERQTPEHPANQEANNLQTEKSEEQNPLPKNSKEFPQQKPTPRKTQKIEEKKLPKTTQRNDEPEMAQSKKKSDGQGIGYASPAKILSFVLLPPLRGGNQLKTLSIPADVNLVNLQLQLETDDFPTYRAVLQNPTDNLVITQTRTRAKNKFLNFQIPVKLLKSQIYLIEVSGIKSDGTAEIIGNYSFKVVR